MISVPVWVLFSVVLLAIVGLIISARDVIKNPPQPNERDLPTPRKYKLPDRPENDDPDRWWG